MILDWRFLIVGESELRTGGAHDRCLDQNPPAPESKIGNPKSKILSPYLRFKRSETIKNPMA